MPAIPEDTAKTKWCPLARVGLDWRVDGHVEHFAANRNNEGEPMGACVASACMLWRWASDVAGYCGLGGAPPLPR